MKKESFVVVVMLLLRIKFGLSPKRSTGKIVDKCGIIIIINCLKKVAICQKISPVV